MHGRDQSFIQTFIRNPEMKTLFRISRLKTGNAAKLVIKETAWENVS